MAERLEEQLVRGLNLTSSQEDRLPDLLAKLDLPLEHVDATKASKESADYTDKGPSPFTCGNCRNYQSGPNKSQVGSCDIVDGDIAEGGSCRWWHRTEAEGSHAESGGATAQVRVYNKPGD